MNRIIGIAELKDIKDINIDMSLPLEERKKEFVKQIGNPYHFKCGKVKVNVAYNGKSTLEDRLVDCLIKK